MTTYKKPDNLAIVQRQNTTDIMIDDVPYKRCKITIECRNPVYKNLFDFQTHMFTLYDLGFKLSKERHSPWYYPLRVTMVLDSKDEKLIKTTKVMGEILSESESMSKKLIKESKAKTKKS